MWFPDPPSGMSWYLTKMVIQSTQNGGFILADRLSHQGGLVGNVTTAQTTNLPTATLTRETTGADVEPWLEWYTTTGTNATNATVTYVDQDGNAAEATATATPIVASVPAARMFPVILNTGDSGVRSVTQVQLSAATASAGAFGVTLIRRIAEVVIRDVSRRKEMDAIALRAPKIDTNASLFLIAQPNFANPTVTGHLELTAAT